MTIPSFSAQAALYQTRNLYHSSGWHDNEAMAYGSIGPAFVPGPETMNRCGGCVDGAAIARDICLAKTAAEVLEGCVASLGFGCGAAVSLGYIQAAACLEGYSVALGYCNIPDLGVRGTGICCPKVCGAPEPWRGSGYGCCDHGEACVGAHNPNTRDGCCPVGQECHGNCCAKGEYCLDGGICSSEPGYFDGSKPPKPPVNNCLFGGAPCGTKCCPPGLQCCGTPFGQPDCKTSCLH